MLRKAIGTACKFDNVTIQRNRFNGPWFSMRFRNRTNFSYSTLGVFCGTTLPPPVRRPDALIVSFQTDKWVNRKGFRLRYFIDCKCRNYKDFGRILIEYVYL